MYLTTNPKIKKINNISIIQEYSRIFEERGISKEAFSVFGLGTLLSNNNIPVFPVYNINNILEGLIIRYGKPFKYVNMFFKRSENLYGIHETYKYIYEKDKVYIVEGVFDMLAAYSIGLKNIVASLGNKLTIKQILLLYSLTTNFEFILDSDSAGISGFNKNKEIINRYFPNISINSRLVYPYKDFSEFIKVKLNENL